jgi:hypothetical protein
MDEDTSNHTMHFISQKQQMNAIVSNKHENTYSFLSL